MLKFTISYHSDKQHKEFVFIATFVTYRIWIFFMLGNLILFNGHFYFILWMIYSNYFKPVLYYSLPV